VEQAVPSDNALRREELCKLRVRDTRHSRYVPLHPATSELLHDPDV
jgi:hypothetical protein